MLDVVYDLPCLEECKEMFGNQRRGRLQGVCLGSQSRMDFLTPRVHSFGICQSATMFTPVIA